MKKKLFLIPLLVSVMALSGCVKEKEKDIKVTGVELNKETLSLNVGDTSTLVASVLPENASDKTVTWASSASSVATIDNGVVTALAAGSSTITVTTNDGNFTDTCVVTVEEVKTEIDVKFSVVSSYVTASVDKKIAKEGDDITITIKSVKDGYDLKAISLNDSEGKTISYTADVATGNKYTYKQPKDGVCKLDATVEGKEIKAYFTAEHGLLDGNPQMSTDGGETYSSVSVAGKEEGRDYYNFKYGSKIKFQFTSNESYVVTGMKVDGVLYKADDKGCVSFDVKIDDFDFFFLDLKVEYEYLKPVGGEYEFKIVNSAHITLKTYKSDKKTELSGADQNDIVYINAKASDADYSVREIKVTAPTSDIGGAAETAVTKIDSEWYSFKTPFSYSKVVTITVVEANNTILKGSDAVGKYMCVSVAPATRTIDEFTEQTVVIDADGTFTMKYNEAASIGDVFVNDDGSTLTTSGTSGYQIPYGGNFVFFCTDDAGKIKTPFGTYNTLCIKFDSLEDTIAMYSVHGERLITDDDHIYVSVSVKRNGENYANAFIDMTNKVAYFGVTYNMLVGDNVDDAIVLYEVFNKDKTKIAVVGSNGAGTYLSRCIMGKHYGTYTKESDTLQIVGSNKATFNDASYSYVISEDTITLTSSTRELVLNLDVENRTFAVVSDVETTLNLPEFAGKKFRSGGCAIEDDLIYYDFYIEFSSTDMKMSTAGGSDYNLDMEHHSTQAFAINENVDYTYDETNKIVSASIVIKGGSTKTVKFTYTNGAFYVQAKDLGSGFYSANVKLSELK